MAFELTAKTVAIFTERAMRPKPPEYLIVVGAFIFIVVLAVSAYFEADIRWLHFFQAWMYLATIVLSLRRSRWGYFVGLSCAGLWDYANLFATSFFFNGLRQLGEWFQTRNVQRPDLLVAVPAWLSNLLIIIGCLWGYSRVADKRPSDVPGALATFAVTTAFFALDVWLFQPRYLSLFRAMLHPHLRF
jgi:hypothetical protein